MGGTTSMNDDSRSSALTSTPPEGGRAASHPDCGRARYGGANGWDPARQGVRMVEIEGYRDVARSGWRQWLVLFRSDPAHSRDTRARGGYATPGWASDLNCRSIQAETSTSRYTTRRPSLPDLEPLPQCRNQRRVASGRRVSSATSARVSSLSDGLSSWSFMVSSLDQGSGCAGCRSDAVDVDKQGL